MTREQQMVSADRIRGIENASERVKMFEFLSIFHPEILLEKRLKMANEANGNS